ncbi:uncharacterized protein (TIGR03905 family) [Parabacteroides sp. PFB2-12]|uniref:TIGR03905 family TSCPD domain-containing protein n=1 Tax=unclassified Parabacteroides TaxID=2649774 RepID=UPI0024752477|nr:MULTISPECIES: TIGR03905 family TSCPD domain-containing protein [unclassified Parabacteroides]MDH6342828.1 uncharacterized protein (TIGR03905 family) [Parabacteroides sp. PM6-13]MDH6390542.1 uncharacterized protein (TIGR03905 family) [Parabacteroides sp. PFB2-12]
MKDKQQIIYVPQGGVCSKKILIDIEENRITDLLVERGCDGNAQGLSALIKGMSVDEAIARLEGIHCGNKTTSCPDQIAQALKTYQSEH